MGERRYPFDMSLRLTSAEYPLLALVEEAEFVATFLHVRGESMAQTGALAGRPARQHYALVAKADGRNEGDVQTWLSTTMEVVSSASDLREGLRAGQIEGVLWIAILWREELDFPEIDPSLVTTATTLGLKIFLENYTRHGDDTKPFPEKLWLGSTM